MIHHLRVPDRPILSLGVLHDPVLIVPLPRRYPPGVEGVHPFGGRAPQVPFKIAVIQVVVPGRKVEFERWASDPQHGENVPPGTLIGPLAPGIPGVDDQLGIVVHPGRAVVVPGPHHPIGPGLVDGQPVAAQAGNEPIEFLQNEIATSFVGSFLELIE